MCTNIVHQATIEGVGKGVKGWFDLRGVNVSYDCPFHIELEHALNIDFVNAAQGPGARVAVELTPDSARELVRVILAALEHAEEGGWLSEDGEHARDHKEVTSAHAP
jgi:hypothetical protein